MWHEVSDKYNYEWEALIGFPVTSISLGASRLCWKSRLMPNSFPWYYHIAIRKIHIIWNLSHLNENSQIYFTSLEFFQRNFRSRWMLKNILLKMAQTSCKIFQELNFLKQVKFFQWYIYYVDIYQNIVCCYLIASF